MEEESLYNKTELENIVDFISEFPLITGFDRLDISLESKSDSLKMNPFMFFIEQAVQVIFKAQINQDDVRKIYNSIDYQYKQEINIFLYILCKQVKNQKFDYSEIKQEMQKVNNEFNLNMYISDDRIENFLQIIDNFIKNLEKCHFINLDKINKICQSSFTNDQKLLLINDKSKLNENTINNNEKIEKIKNFLSKWEGGFIFFDLESLWGKKNFFQDMDITSSSNLSEFFQKVADKEIDGSAILSLFIGKGDFLFGKNGEENRKTLMKFFQELKGAKIDFSKIAYFFTAHGDLLFAKNEEENRKKLIGLLHHKTKLQDLKNFAREMIKNHKEQNTNILKKQTQEIEDKEDVLLNRDIEEKMIPELRDVESEIIPQAPTGRKRIKTDVLMIEDVEKQEIKYKEDVLLNRDIEEKMIPELRDVKSERLNLRKKIQEELKSEGNYEIKNISEPELSDRSSPTAQLMLKLKNEPLFREDVLQELQKNGYSILKHDKDAFSVASFNKEKKLEGDVFFEDKYIQTEFIAKNDKPFEVKSIVINPEEKKKKVVFTRRKDDFTYEDSGGIIILPDQSNPKLNKFLLQLCDTETETDVKLNKEEIDDIAQLEANLALTKEKIVGILCTSTTELNNLLNNLKKLKFKEDIMFKIEISSQRAGHDSSGHVKDDSSQRVEHDLVCYKKTDGETLIIDQGGISNPALVDIKKNLIDNDIIIKEVKNPSRKITFISKAKNQLTSQQITLPNDESILCCRHATNLIFETIKEIGIDSFLKEYTGEKSKLLCFLTTHKEAYKNVNPKLINSSVSKRGKNL